MRRLLPEAFLRSRPAVQFDLVMCDTCVGGSTVAVKLARHVSGLRLFYLADYAVNPLGVKSADQVRAALLRWVDIAASRAATLVVACNTASARLSECPDVAERCATERLRLISMLDFLDRAIRARPGCLTGASVCLMGTAFTVGHGAYRERLLRAGARTVVPLPATRTERIIAALQHTTRQGRRAIREEIQAAVGACDAVVLACTCFPLIVDLIQQINPTCVALDPADGADDCVTGTPGTQNRLTLALSGPPERTDELRARMPGLFSGWFIDDVLRL